LPPPPCQAEVPPRLARQVANTEELKLLTDAAYIAGETRPEGVWGGAAVPEMVCPLHPVFLWTLCRYGVSVPHRA
jgi:hypothetical protein